MAAHRYWRIRALTVPGTFLELSELQLFNGATRVDVPATVTSSSAPEGGSLADLKDGNTSTRAYWSQTVAQNAAFWIAWDFGTATEVNAVKQGGYDTASRYMSAFTAQWSDDGTSWTDIAAFASLVYPGNGTLSIAYSWAPVTPEQALVLAVGSNGYTTGQTLANWELTPADGAAQAAYDFWLGLNSSAASDDPAFTSGSPGFFSFDGGTYFQGKESTAFLRSLHKAGAKFTIELWIRWDSAVGTNVNPFFDSGTSDQSGSDMSRGVIYGDVGNLVGTPGRHRLRVMRDSGGAAALQVQSDAALPNATLTMLACSIDSTGITPSFLYKNGAYDPVAGNNTWSGVYSSPGTADATNTAKIGARGDGVFKLPSGTRLYGLRVYNAALTKAQLDDLYAAGVPAPQTFSVSGTVRNAAGTGVARTVRAYLRSTGALLTQTTSAADGTFSMVLTTTAPVYVVALDDAENLVAFDHIVPA